MDVIVLVVLTLLLVANVKNAKINSFLSFKLYYLFNTCIKIELDSTKGTLHMA